MKRSLTVGLFVCASVSLAGGAFAQGGGQSVPPEALFVDQSVTGPGSGTYSDPFKSLDDALTNANRNTSTFIYIAEGDYEPSLPGGDPGANTFLLENWVFLIGGWDGQDRSWPPVVDPELYPVVLEGQYGSGQGDRVWNVVSVPDDAAGIQGMDGVTVARGTAHGGVLRNRGGGLLVDRAEVYVVDCEFVDNHAPRGYGGGIYNAGGEVYVYNSRFYGNTAQTGGGAIANGDWQIEEAVGGLVEIWGSRLGSDEPGDENAANIGGAVFTGATHDDKLERNRTRIFNSLFESNQATSGGAVYVEGFATVGFEKAGTPADTLIYTTRFIGNEAVSGGAVYITPSAFPACLWPVVWIVNSGFCENEAFNSGGGVFINAHDDPPTPQCSFQGQWPISMSVHIVNCTFTENSAPLAPGIFTAGAFDVVIRNTILWNDDPVDQIFILGGIDPTVEYSNVQLEDTQAIWPGTGNWNVDPELTTSPAVCDCAISGQSPMIDEGLQVFIPFDHFDIDGDSNTSERLPDLILNDRVVGQEVDIGAREVQNR